MRSIAFYVFVLSLSFVAQEARASCSVSLPRDESQKPREINARDLIELNDIGYPDPAITGESPLAVSPDGKNVAFVVRRADLQSNGYCYSLILLPLHPGSWPRVVDSGGEFIPLSTFVRNLEVEVGLPAQVTPIWSSDGRKIFYLKRLGGSTQIYAVPLDGSAAKAITSTPSDIEGLFKSRDGRHILFLTRPALLNAQIAIDAEGRSGWLYDERVAANAGPRPRLTEAQAPLKTFELAADGTGPALELANDALPLQVPIKSAKGFVATMERTGTSILSLRRLSLTAPDGRKISCAATECIGGITGMWWNRSGSELRFLRREGWNNELYAFYRWDPEKGGPTRVFATTDTIQNCVSAANQLVCTVENAARPRRIELIDPVRGNRHLLFDPNPQFRSLELGSVTRLRWRNDRGLEVWGDLVLPPHRHARQKFPLIVVQYNSRGFLRGGTGDEYPIFLFARRGFAVLSFERPRNVAESVPGIKNDVDANAADEKGWAERRSVESALLNGIDAAISAGNVDAKRIGITGLSDGATAVRFALINSKRFAAAAISSCCVEPKTAMTYGGIAWAEFNRKVGYPLASAKDSSFWTPMSIALNATHIHTPLLMQLADEEFVLSLEAFEALREAHAPVELYVFPNEHHVKWQPIHRLAIYERNLDWFDFWLRCREDPSLQKAAQNRRWRALKEHAASFCP